MQMVTLPETKIAPKSDGFQLESPRFQGSNCSGDMLVSGRVLKSLDLFFGTFTISEVVGSMSHICFVLFFGVFMVFVCNTKILASGLNDLAFVYSSDVSPAFPRSFAWLVIHCHCAFLAPPLVVKFAKW